MSREPQEAGAPAEAAVTVDKSVTWPQTMPAALVRRLVAEWTPRPPDERDLALSRLLFGEPQEDSRGQ